MTQESIEKRTISILNNQNVKTVLIFLIIIYASTVKPELPEYLKKMFKNSFFKVMILTLIVHRSQNDSRLALSIALGFMVIMNLLTTNTENFTAHSPDSEDDTNSCDRSYDTDPLPSSDNSVIDKAEVNKKKKPVKIDDDSDDEDEDIDEEISDNLEEEDNLENDTDEENEDIVNNSKYEIASNNAPFNNSNVIETTESSVNDDEDDSDL